VVGVLPDILLQKETGAPGEPTQTMFQTPPIAPPMFAFLVNHYYWLPGKTFPDTYISDIYPPLA